MAPRRVLGAVFALRSDGCIEMPAWAAEIMYVFMVYMPYSWREIVAKLRNLEPFMANLDEYKLVYSFCLAINTRDSILLNLVSYDTVAERFVLPPTIDAVYDGQPTPLSFWARPTGMVLRNSVSGLMSIFRPEYRAFSEFTDTRRAWEDFCQHVDHFSSLNHSRIDWVVMHRHQRARYLSRVLINAYRTASSISGQGHGTAGVQSDESLAIANSLLRDLREMTLTPIPTNSGVNSPTFAVSTAALERARYRLIQERDNRVLRILNTWRVPYPRGVGETCCICLEDIPVPSVAASYAPININARFEVPVRTPCKHYFGLDCLKLWLSEHQSCPLCRRLIVRFTMREREIESYRMLLESQNRIPRPAEMFNWQQASTPPANGPIEGPLERNSLP